MRKEREHMTDRTFSFLFFFSLSLSLATQEREEEEILAEARRIRDQRKQEAERKALLAEDKGAVSMADIPTLDLNSLPRQPRGPWLRSALARRTAADMAPNLGTKIVRRLDQIMTELGVGKSPLVATELVCNCYLALRQEMLKLLDVQKRLARKEQVASRRAVRCQCHADRDHLCYSRCLCPGARQAQGGRASRGKARGIGSHGRG